MTDIITVHECRFDQPAKWGSDYKPGHVPMQCRCGRRKNFRTAEFLSPERLGPVPRLQEW